MATLQCWSSRLHLQSQLLPCTAPQGFTQIPYLWLSAAKHPPSFQACLPTAELPSRSCYVLVFSQCPSLSCLFWRNLLGWEHGRGNDWSWESSALSRAGSGQGRVEGRGERGARSPEASRRPHAGKDLGLEGFLPHTPGENWWGTLELEPQAEQWQLGRETRGERATALKGVGSRENTV